MFFDNKEKTTGFPPFYIQSSSSTTIRIESTNFQNNTDDILIYTSSHTVYLQNCCFANNNISKYYFDEWSGGQITIDSCFIDEETPKTTGSVTINNRIKDTSNNDICINFIKKKEEDISDLDENPKYINFSILSHNLINISSIV